MVILEHDVLCRVKLYVITVYLFTLVFMLSERADIEVVTQYFRDGYDAPRFLHLAFIFIALGFLTRFLSHAWGWDMLISQMIGNSFVTPAVDIICKYSSDDLCRRLVYLERHFLCVCYHVAERHGADPLSP